MTKEDFIKLRKQTDKLEISSIHKLALSSSKARKELKLVIEKLISKYGEKEISKQILKEGLRADVKNEISAILSELLKENKPIVKGLMVESYNNSFKVVIGVARTETKKSLLGIIPTKKLRDTALNKEIAGYNWAEKLTIHRNNLVIRVQSNVIQGLENGESYSAIAQRIDNTIGYASKTGVNGGLADSVKIARTESHRMITEAEQDCAKSLSSKGVKGYKTWISSRDSRVRDAHASLDGKKIPIDADFTSPTGAKGQGPGMMGNASDDINCRCILAYSFE